MDSPNEKLNIERTVYKSSDADLEGLIFKPQQGKKLPGVVFIHGHRSSAWHSALIGYVLQRNGFVALLPSQRGYGLSKGERDFCGPKTLRGIYDGVKLFMECGFVNVNKIAVWGISRGATLASLLITQWPQLFQAAVLQSGVYDMTSYYSTALEGIRAAIESESGTTKSAFDERSSLNRMEKLACPTLIIHGEGDERVSANQARVLDMHLKQFNKIHDSVMISGANHFLSESVREQYVHPFLQKHLK